MYITPLSQKSYHQGKMDEQRELEELKRLMTEQQSKLANTMAEMELKASTLQEKFDKKSELSKSNAEAGVKKVALEYKVVEFEVDLPYPPGFDPYPETDDEDLLARRHRLMSGRSSPQGQVAQEAQEAQEQARVERLKARLNEARRVLKNIKLEAVRQCRVFEMTKLKELGEDGWTLQSIDHLQFTDIGVYEGDKLQKNESITKLYYFSRPL
jgi:hypothetical protein